MELRTRRSSCEASADPVLAVPVRALKRARVVVSTKLKIGFVCGKADGDVVVAPGIPPEFWVRRSRPEEVHTDVAIWWLVRTRYEHSVEADLIHAPHDVTSARLRRNDVNLLLGWDAVSAHLEERDPTSGCAKGHGAKMAALLLAPTSKVWPPASLQQLCNAKGAYIAECQQRNVATAPTAVLALDTRKKKKSPAHAAANAAGAAWCTATAATCGWKKFVVKPSPSSWSRGVEIFLTAPTVKKPDRLQDYFDQNQTAQHIILQRHLTGLQMLPETRCFFFGNDFLYAVANSRHPKNKALELTASPESASSSRLDGSLLPAKYWKPHVELARRVLAEVLPELVSFQGKQLSTRVPWLVRVDVGLHRAADLANAPATRRRAELVPFINEVEIVPTLYLGNQFAHPKNFLLDIATRLVGTAAEVAGVLPPQLDAAPDRGQ